MKSNFDNMREISSLERLILTEKEKIKSAQDRVLSIENQRKRRAVSLSSLKERRESHLDSQSQLEKREFELSRDIEKAKDRIHSLTTQAQVDSTEKEIQTKEEEYFEVENNLLNMMEALENMEGEIEEANTFLAGSLKSLEKIQNEVNEECQGYEKEISNYQLRIDSLYNQFGESDKNLFLRIKKKHLIPFSRIKSSTCEECRMQLSPAIIQSVEKADKMHSCPTCSRILIPANY